MGNFIVHRGESLFSLWNTLRFYLVWRVIKHSVFDKFPKRHTVSRFWSINLQSQYAFKHLLNSWMSVVYIAFTWLFWICLSAYWYRTFELTACNLETTLSEICKEERALEWVIGDDVFVPEKTIYIQNSLWLMFVTSTTVGYGDLIPVTHFGRATTCVTGLMGTMLASLLIASISNVLSWTPKEKVAIALLEREQARFDLERKAARLLLAWLVTRRDKRAGRKPSTDFFSMRRDFYLTKARSRVLVEDCIGDSAKIESIAKRVKKCRQAITALSEALYCPDLLPGESQKNWEGERYKSMMMRRGPSVTPEESLRVVPEQKQASIDKSSKSIDRTSSTDRQRIDSEEFDSEMENRITATMNEVEKKEYFAEKAVGIPHPLKHAHLHNSFPRICNVRLCAARTHVCRHRPNISFQSRHFAASHAALSQSALITGQGKTDAKGPGFRERRSEEENHINAKGEAGPSAGGDAPNKV